jgi:hypothetical protein
MTETVATSVSTIPSGVFILLGFFALIVLAIVIWSIPNKANDKTKNLNPTNADGNKTKQ